MPCYSAKNVRITSGAEQLSDCKELKRGLDRSRSAYRTSSSVGGGSGGLRQVSGACGGGRGSRVGFGRHVSSSNGGRLANDRMVFTPFHRNCEQLVNYNSKELHRAQAIKKRNLALKDVTLTQDDLKRLKDVVNAPTVEDRLNEIRRQDEENRRMTEEAERIRLYFKEIDDERKAKLKEAEQEADDNGQNQKLDDKAMLLNRMRLARQEQEEDVKLVNRMILDAKCHAVRDAQIQEKHMIAEELKKEELRLHQIVVDRAKNALTKEEEAERQESKKRSEYGMAIRKQLRERENMRFLEAERIEEEAKFSRRTTELLKEEEEQQRKLINERKQKFRAELERLKEISKIFKKMLCEQERLADMRILAYMEEKRKKEEKLQYEKRLAKQDFERIQKKLYTMVEKSLQNKNSTEEITYLREQDRLEREYRKKEKAAAIRKREVERELLEARAHQAQEHKNHLAIQIAQAEQDFNVLMERLKEEEEKQKELDKERLSRRNNYRRDIMQQMTDKEMERRRLLDIERARTLEWKQAEDQREANIKSVINAKIRDMRENCLPERYVKEVEKQLTKIQASKNKIH